MFERQSSRYHSPMAYLNDPGEGDSCSGWGESHSESDPIGPVQLGLFTPDRAEVEAGFTALGQLDLERAEGLFRGVLERQTDDEDARQGLEAVEHWRGLLADLAERPPLERAAALWRSVHECPPVRITRTLRRNLLEGVLEVLETEADPVPIGDLCVAEVLLELNRPEAARSWLEWSIGREPGRARLHLLRGNVEWARRQEEAARACYSLGLLVDPTLERWQSVAWRLLARRISESGGVATALEWWAAGRLPLPPLDVALPPHEELAEAWRALAGADDARRCGRFEEAIERRARLRAVAPEIFATYMERLERS